MNDVDAAAGSPTAYCERVADEVCARLAAGESEASICRDARMPAYATLRSWRRASPPFAARCEAARAAGGTSRGGRPGDFSPELGEAICARIAAGEAMRDICSRRGMPGMTTVFRWLERHAGFAEAYRLAREIQAHDKFDAVWSIARAATPANAAVARLQIGALTWQIARLAPRRYGPRAEAVADAAPQPFNVIIRHFGDPEDDEPPLQIAGPPPQDGAL